MRRKFRPGMWPAPSADGIAPDPPNLAEIAEAQRQAWRIAQRKAQLKKARNLYRKTHRRQQRLEKATIADYKVIAFDAKARYSERRQEVFRHMEMSTWSRTPRNIDEVQAILIAMAKKVGSIYGVTLTVGRKGDELIFVSDNGEAVVDPGGLDNPATVILCAQNHEIDSGDFLKLFAARSLYAALTVRFNQMDTSTSRTQPFEQ